MRVSLKDLFAVTAFGAVMAWCAGEARIDNGMFWMVLGVSAALCVVFVLIAKNKQGRWLTLLIPPGAFFFCMIPLASTALLYILGALFVAGLACTFLPPMRVRTLTGIAMVCMMAASVAAVFEGRSEIARVREMQREFPVVSLVSRLEYERRAGASLSPPTLAPEVGEELTEWEQTQDYSSREARLQRLHDRQYELFIRASGFGFGRMMRPYPESMRRAPLRDIPFDEIATMESSDRSAWRGAWRAGVANDVEHLHMASRDDFLDPDGFGATLARLERVAGFVEHALHAPPTAYLENRAAWAIARLELVSLLKFDGPRVYVLDHLPRMDQLAENDAPTRALDPFEAAALVKLQTDEDVVIAEIASDVRMLGSLRAGQQCLDCHSVPRGALLGAFSYVLRRGEAPVEAPGEESVTTALAAFGGGFTTEDTEGTELE